MILASIVLLHSRVWNGSSIAEMSIFLEKRWSIYVQAAIKAVMTTSYGTIAGMLPRQERDDANKSALLLICWEQKTEVSMYVNVRMMILPVVLMYF